MRRFIGYGLKTLFILFFLALIWALWNRELVAYGWMQLQGQINIVYSSRPVKEVMDDGQVSDSTKLRLKFIEEIRRFAADSLGLKDSENYTSFYDQQSKPLLWVLTASDPFKLAAYHWKFPVVGEVSYKGFFQEEKGKEEEDILRNAGYDTDLSPVSAWSTLGWFKDPILSGMLKRSDGSLAELIIHEMTHTTLYVKSDVNFNENLASVIGEVGAIKFLSSRFGDDSSELKEYLLRKEDTDMYSKHMLRAAAILDTLYGRIENLEEPLKQKFKQDRMTEIVKSLDTINFHFPHRYKKSFEKSLPNNTYFLSFIRYDSQKEEMLQEIETKYDNDISAYLEVIGKRYK
ncbi:MAG TPA: aminopeptidase [Bacteroidia bacterium]|nr:aminopeptidase [Bacteroidia bacterium]